MPLEEAPGPGRQVDCPHKSPGSVAPAEETKNPLLSQPPLVPSPARVISNGIAFHKPRPVRLLSGSDREHVEVLERHLAGVAEPGQRPRIGDEGVAHVANA